MTNRKNHLREIFITLGIIAIVLLPVSSFLPLSQLASSLWNSLSSSYFFYSIAYIAILMIVTTVFGLKAARKEGYGDHILIYMGYTQGIYVTSFVIVLLGSIVLLNGDPYLTKYTPEELRYLCYGYWMIGITFVMPFCYSLQFKSVLKQAMLEQSNQS